MDENRLSEVLQYLSRASHGLEEFDDGQLLERFVRNRDETAFSALIDRLGPMVLGICRRVLHDLHDAEDAFQATFLVLVGKASSINRARAVSSWLYSIAHRTAMRAKCQRLRRRESGGVIDEMPAPDATIDLAWHELRPALDEELRRLPRKYRDTVILCYLQRKTYTEAAKILGLPAGTIASRLARARDALRKRLVRRGLVLSSSLLSTILSQNALSSAVPVALRDTIVRTALTSISNPMALANVASQSVMTLVDGVQNAMSNTRISIAIVLALGTLGLGSVALLYAGSDTHRSDAIHIPSQSQEPAISGKKGVFEPETLVSRQDKRPTGAEKKNADDPEPFENDKGYTWALEPIATADGDLALSLKSGHAALMNGGNDGISLTYLQNVKGDLFINLAGVEIVNKTKVVEYRVVVLDHHRKRYLATPCGGIVGHSDGDGLRAALQGFLLTSRVLPVGNVRYLGVERKIQHESQEKTAKKLEARKDDPKALKMFENGMGYTWALGPEALPGDIDRSLKEGNACYLNGGNDGLALVLLQNLNGDLFVSQVGVYLVGKPKLVDYRLVVLDAGRQRYLPTRGSAINSATDDQDGDPDRLGRATHAEEFILKSEDLPLEKVRHIGIEQKAIVAKTPE